MVEEFGKVVKPKHKFMKDGDTETREDDDPKSATFGETVLSSTSTHLQNAFYITNINADKVVMYNPPSASSLGKTSLRGDQDIYTAMSKRS